MGWRRRDRVSGRRDVSSSLALTAMILVCWSVSLLAADVYVDQGNQNCPGTGTKCDPFCTISAAIAAASSGDRVRIASGTYVENLTITSKDLDLIGTGCQAVTIVDGNASGSVVTVNTSNLDLQGLTLTNGSAFSGAGVHVGSSTNGSALSLTSCAVSGNTAYQASGSFIQNSSNSLSLTNSTVSGNFSGGVYQWISR